MYYPKGWARLLRLPQLDSQENPQEIQHVVCNRDKILTALVTDDSVIIWYVKPCVPIISHRRSKSSVEELGKNVLAQWRPDSSMIVVVTEKEHLIIYHLVVPTDIKTLYELVDPPTPSLKRESDELFVKELIPPLIFSLAFEVFVQGGISDLVAIREELMIATKNGHILRYTWEGQEKRDYSLDLKRIPFCTDQQVLKAVPLSDKGVFVSKIAYSPLIGGYAVVFNDGRAAFLFSSTVNFDPNSVTGVWALQLEDAICVTLNHKFKLIAFGRKNSEGIVYNVDEMTGGLVISHRLRLPTRDYPGCPGPVSCMKWTPDGTALAMAWERGGFSIWSTFGAMIMCSLCWDYGPLVSDPVGQNPLCIKSMDWSAEGYQMWIVNSKIRSQKITDPEFMPFPENFEGNSKNENNDDKNPLGNKSLVLQFVKSPSSVNPYMTKQEDIYLQGEDRIFFNMSQRQSNNKFNNRKGSVGLNDQKHSVLFGGEFSANNSNHPGLVTSGSKHWITIAIPHNYIGSSWPIRYTAMDDTSEHIAVAGRTGFAHYSISLRKWRLFGNETQEKDFIVTGGLLWWRDHIVMGCYNLAGLHDEIRIYPRIEKLDNSFAKIVKVDAQVLLLNLFNDQLVVFCADNIITIYNLSMSDPTNPQSIAMVDIERCKSFDASRIHGLSFHPACVVLVALSNLKTETTRMGNRDSVPREGSPGGSGQTSAVENASSLILNICGRVVMIQPESRPRHGSQSGERSDSPQLTIPTVLATCCETIWFPRRTNVEKPHLTASLWLYCGAHGMRVWLPVFPREGDHGHTFMSKRIMLHFPLEKFYPLAILFEDAIILGAENDTILFNASNISTTHLPYCVLERSSLVFLHPILRQLIRRNLGYHAWEIARTCMNLPYFQHSLELLLHEVLEEEATSTEPIPDALLPSVVEFIQEFPIYHKTIGRCARKTEVALWPHLFSAVGSPRTLFTECISNNDLETAASYLLILQNLEPPTIAQNHATLLLDAALDRSSWDLAKELVRFLRTIDPEEVEEASQRPLAAINPTSPPINKSAPEEEISLLLGTLQVPRGRSTSVTHGAAKISPKDAVNHKDLSRSNSETKTSNNYRARIASTSSQKDEKEPSAEEFFIDVILQRHARKLLSAGRLFDLGTFAAQLDFHMVSWLKKESHRAARIDNFVLALKRLHAEFHWPYPLLLSSVLASISNTTIASPTTSEDVRKSSNSSGMSSTLVPASASNSSPNPMNNLGVKKHVFDGLQSTPAGISDSGYLSHATEEPYSNGGRDSRGPVYNMDHAALSEQTINAMLRPLGFREDLSVLSEDVASLISPDERFDSPGNEWFPQSQTSIQQDLNQDYGQELISKGPAKAEVQLRYLLQIMMEANCLEIASLISVLLKDALALIRIVNAARSTTPGDANSPNSQALCNNGDKTVVTRLYQNLKALEAWAQSECHGYAPFFQAIQPQLNSLRTYLLQQSKSSVNHLPTTPGTAAGSGHPGSSSQHKKSSAASSSSTTSSAAAMLNASQAVVNNSNISIGKDHTSSSTNSAIQPNMMASTSRKPSPATANVAANVGSVIHNGGEFSTPISGRTQYTGNLQYKRSSTSPKLTFKKDLNRTAFGSSGDRVDGGGTVVVGKTADHLARSARSVENLNQFDEKNHSNSAKTETGNLQKSTSDSGLDELNGTPDQDGSGCIVS